MFMGNVTGVVLAPAPRLNAMKPPFGVACAIARGIPMSDILITSAPTIKRADRFGLRIVAACITRFVASVMTQPKRD
jgi:hypothetical protein